MLIDDDPDTLQLLSVMLAESNASVQTAVSVAQALALGILQWYEPNVLVSDLLKRFPKKEARNNYISHFAHFHARKSRN